MKNKIFVSAVLVVGLCFANIGMAITDNTTTDTQSVVNSITLKYVGEGKIQWVTDGVSAQGFKVVWSKNENPTYPLRDGDKYHYFTDPNYTNDRIEEAFASNGTYYVRVCEYLGGKCGVYSNQVAVELTSNTPKETKNNSNNKNKVYYGDNGNLEKIPNLDVLQDYTNIQKIGDSLYGVKITIPTNKEKILKIEDIKYFKAIEKIGNSLYGIRIADEKKLQIQKKIDNLNEQIKKIQDQILKLNEEMSKL